MKRNLILIALVLAGLSCKKKDTAPKTNGGQMSLFRDTARLHTGADTTPYKILKSVRQVSDNDAAYGPLINDALSHTGQKQLNNFLRMFSHIRAAAAMVNPATFEMVMPPAGDQNPHNSCVAYALGYGMLGYDYHQIENWTDYSNAYHLFAANYIYNQLNHGKDDGIQYIQQALELVKTQGCSQLIFMPDVDDVLSQPSQQAMANAADYTIEDYQVFPTADVNRIKTFLAKGYPLLFAAKTNADFKAINLASFKVLPDKRILYTKWTGGKIERHAMVLVGYDDSINAFKVMNSWGPAWGNDGFFWIDYDAFKSILSYSFVIPELYLVIPKSVFTKNATALTTTSAQSGGNVVLSEDGEVIGRGVCYAAGPKPTLNSSVKKGGAGTGKFAVTLDNLKPGSVYYARAYATTGAGTKYGNQISFETPASDSSAYYTSKIVGKWQYVKFTANTTGKFASDFAVMTFKADGTISGTDLDGDQDTGTWSISGNNLTLVDAADATDSQTWQIITLSDSQFVFLDPNVVDQSNGNLVPVTFYFSKTQ